MFGLICILSVDSPNPDGKYVEGDKVSIVLEFSGPVDVTGTPLLDLNHRFGTGNRTASYVSGSGTTNLTFDYTVQKFDVSDDLDYVSQNSLTLEGGSINSAADSNAALLKLPKDGLSKNRDIQIGEVFTSQWFTNVWSGDSSPRGSLKLPLEESGDYDFIIFWGDGTNSTITSWNQAETLHTYPNNNQRTVNIFGKIEGFKFNWGANNNDRAKLNSITRWGPLRLGNSGAYFERTNILYEVSAKDVNLSGTTNLSKMFYYSNFYNSNGNIGSWDVSEVTDMSYMLSYSQLFNENISDWDVSEVTNMSHMFDNAFFYNKHIGDWNTSKVVDMSSMFHLCG